VGRFRLIFAYASDGAIEVIFIEERGLIYEVFEAEFVKRLKS
jgi:mRNA interferase RelE/StbE